MYTWSYFCFFLPIPSFISLLLPHLFWLPLYFCLVILSSCHLSFFPPVSCPPLLSKSTPDTLLLPLSPCRVEAAGYQRVLQVDLEVNGLMVIQGGREVTWQVEYPLTRTLTSEVPTLIRLAPQDLGGIVPLAMVRRGGGLSCGSWKLVCMQTFVRLQALKSLLMQTKAPEHSNSPFMVYTSTDTTLPLTLYSYHTSLES